MKLKITIEQDNYKKENFCIWLEGLLHICSLPKTELTPDVLKAIVSAVKRGMEVQRNVSFFKINEPINIETEVNI